MYEQLKTPNLDPVVYVNGKILYDWMGWCLAVSETMFGVPRLYDNAWEGWNATKIKHKDRNFPKGVYIPIWFDGYWNGQRYGHVAIYKDGKIWSSPYTHKATADTFTSIESVEKIYGMTFVGWSDDIAGVYVIKKGEEMLTGQLAAILVRAFCGRGISAQEQKDYVGKITADAFANKVKTWGTHKSAVTASKNGTLIATDFLMSEIRAGYPRVKAKDINSGFTEVTEKLYRKK